MTRLFVRISKTGKYKKEVVNRSCNVLLPMLAKGFLIQNSTLFGFGPEANESTGTLLKISAASATVKEKLNQITIQFQ